MQKAALFLALALLSLFLVAGLDVGAEPEPERTDAEPKRGFEREHPELLPDWSDGRTGILGPFVWSRALDMGEDARFSDRDGRPDPTGEFLWTHQWARLPHKRAGTPILHARNNFVSRRREVCFTVQPWHYLLYTPGTHNSKTIIGYVQNAEQPPFQHSDNADLAHLAAGERVCLFIPIRARKHGGDPLDQNRYTLNTLVQTQPICVIQFGKGRMIHYEWFRSDTDLNENVLFNLAPYFRGKNELKPGIAKPIFQFDIDGKGGWRVQIERDGRDGLAGGEVDGDYDLTFTHESEGAKPYTVDVTRENSAWSLSFFSPGGKPMETSEIIVGLKPYDRDTGRPTAWPDRETRIRNLKIDQLPSTLATLRKRDRGETPTK